MNAKKPGGLQFNPLLSRTEPNAPGEEKEDAVHTVTPVDNQTRVHADTPTGPSKFTFYFTPQQLNRLDDVWETMRRQVRGRGQRVSKSRFVRLALDRLLDDFEREPAKVIQWLTEQPET